MRVKWLIRQPVPSITSGLMRMHGVLTFATRRICTVRFCWTLTVGRPAISAVTGCIPVAMPSPTAAVVCLPICLTAGRMAVAGTARSSVMRRLSVWRATVAGTAPSATRRGHLGGAAGRGGEMRRRSRRRRSHRRSRSRRCWSWRAHTDRRGLDRGTRVRELKARRHTLGGYGRRSRPRCGSRNGFAPITRGHGKRLTGRTVRRRQRVMGTYRRSRARFVQATACRR